MLDRRARRAHWEPRATRAHLPPVVHRKRTKDAKNTSALSHLHVVTSPFSYLLDNKPSLPATCASRGQRLPSVDRGRSAFPELTRQQPIMPQPPSK